MFITLSVVALPKPKILNITSDMANVKRIENKTKDTLTKIFLNFMCMILKGVKKNKEFPLNV